MLSPYPNWWMNKYTYANKDVEIIKDYFYIWIFRNSVRLAIRKIMYAPQNQGEQPSIEVSKEFMMSPNKLHLEASLDKELYYHGESIAVNVHVANNSNRTVKKIKVSVRQFADICLFSTAQYKCTVAESESEWVESIQKEMNY